MSSYIVTHEPTSLDHAEFMGVTSIMKTLDKSGALIPWALGLAEKWALEQVSGLSVVNADNVKGIILSAKDKYKEVSNTALDIGSMVHDQIEYHIKAQMDGIIYTPPELPKEVKRCFGQFLFWEREKRPEWLESESKIVNPVIGYAGTLDAICKINGVTFLLDFKTSKTVYPEYALQLAAYKQAREAMNGEYLFEHEYEVMQDGIKQKAYISSVESYNPIKIDGCAILRFNKESADLAEFKDVTKQIPSKTRAFNSLVDFYYCFQNRRLKNNPIIKKLKGEN